MPFTCHDRLKLQFPLDFRNDLFRSELENELSNYDINKMDYDIFLGTFVKILSRS